MPSPFPGMDPYLESPSLFPGLHGRLIAYMAEALQAVLPEPYYAEIYERIVVEESGRLIEPDVNVFGDGPERRGEGAATEQLAPTATLPIVVTITDDEFTETFLEILSSAGDGERTVAVVEVLSPSNKRQGSRGRDFYVRKQAEVLRTDSHLARLVQFLAASCCEELHKSS